MSELVVNLQDPESVSLARQILETLGNDWPNPITSGVSASRNGGEAGGSASASAELTPPWEGPNEIDRSGRAESDSKPDDADPWATSAPSLPKRHERRAQRRLRATRPMPLPRLMTIPWS